MKTDTTEKGLDTLIMRHMTGTDGLATGAAGAFELNVPKMGSFYCKTVLGTPH